MPRALRLLDPGADWRLQIDAELRLVGRRKELGADQGSHSQPRRCHQAEARHEGDGDRADHEPAVTERPLDQPLIELLGVLEEALR
jgi:hypothetical protein